MLQLAVVISQLRVKVLIWHCVSDISIKYRLFIHSKRTFAANNWTHILAIVINLSKVGDNRHLYMTTALVAHNDFLVDLA